MPPHGLARLKLPSGGGRDARRIAEESVRIEDVILDEIIGVTVKLVRPRFGLHQNDRATRTPEFGGVGVGEHLKFPDRADIDVLAVLIFG